MTPGNEMTPGNAPAPVPGAALTEVARLFVDRPAAFSWRAAEQPAEAVTADLVATTSVSAKGELVAHRISLKDQCPAPVTSAAPVRRRVPEEFATIQAALDASQPGDDVLVAPGVYHERVKLRSGVRLLGSGAWRTTLDGQGEAATLVDYTDASNAVLQGFTLRGVGQASTCGSNVFGCAGDAYAAAVYGDGHNRWEGTLDGGDPCADTSIVVTQNVFHDNAIAMMAYFHARAIVRNNIFVGNDFGFVANHFNNHALIVNNVFIDNRTLAVGSSAAYLDIIGNIVAGSATAVQHEYVQMGRVTCNAFIANASVGERVPVGTDGNITFERAFVDPAGGDYRPTPELVAALAWCFEAAPGLADWLRREPGAFGGVLGVWPAPPVQ